MGFRHRLRVYGVRESAFLGHPKQESNRGEAAFASLAVQRVAGFPPEKDPSLCVSEGLPDSIEGTTLTQASLADT